MDYSSLVWKRPLSHCVIAAESRFYTCKMTSLSEKLICWYNAEIYYRQHMNCCIFFSCEMVNIPWARTFAGKALSSVAVPPALTSILEVDARLSVWIPIVAPFEMREEMHISSWSYYCFIIILIMLLLLLAWLFSIEYCFYHLGLIPFKQYPTLFFSNLASGRNPPNPAIWLVPRAGGYFTILPANQGAIVGSFIHEFVCCLWMSKNRHFQTIQNSGHINFIPELWQPFAKICSF